MRGALAFGNREIAMGVKEYSNIAKCKMLSCDNPENEVQLDLIKEPGVGGIPGKVTILA